MVRVSNENGSVLVWALVVLGVLSTLAMGAAALSSNEVQIAHNEHNEVKAFYVAEAGLEMGKKYIYTNVTNHNFTLPEFAGDSVSINLSTIQEGVVNEIGQADIWIEKSSEDNIWIIKSKGYYNSAVETVSQTLKIVLGGVGGETIPPAIGTVTNTLVMRTDIPSEKWKHVTIDGTTIVDPDTVNETVTVLDVLDELGQAVRNHPDVSGTGELTGEDVLDDLSYGLIEDNVYYGSGDAVMRGGFSGEGSGVIFVDGNVTFNGGAYIQSSGKPLILIVNGDIVVNGGVTLGNVILISAGTITGHGWVSTATDSNGEYVPISIAVNEWEVFGHQNTIVGPGSLASYNWLEEYGIGCDVLQFGNWSN